MFAGNRGHLRFSILEEPWRPSVTGMRGTAHILEGTSTLTLCTAGTVGTWGTWSAVDPSLAASEVLPVLPVLLANLSFCRTFSLLNARRPDISEEKGAKIERRRPDWMPPPKVFPVIWITIGVLRALSSTLVSVSHYSLYPPLYPTSPSLSSGRILHVNRSVHLSPRGMGAK